MTSKLFEAEHTQRRTLQDEEEFALQKMYYLKKVDAQHKQDPTDVCDQTPLSLRKAAKEKMQQRQRDLAVVRSEMKVKSLEVAHVKVIEKQTLQRKPSQYEVLMNRARSFQRLAVACGETLRDEYQGRVLLQQQQLEGRKQIVQCQLHELNIQKRSVLRR